MTATLEATPRYQFKPGPYSSHGLLLKDLPNDGSGRRILDVGCAGGYLSEILVQRGFSVTGIDVPGTPHSPHIDFLAADLQQGLPSALEGRFDYIICADVLEHLRDPLRLLQECRERLRPGAMLMGSLPNSGHAWFRWNVLTGRFPQQERGLFDSTHLHFYTWEGWVDLFRRAGLRVETVRSSGVPVGLAAPRWNGTAVINIMERLSFESARVWKEMFGYQFVVSAREERIA